MHKFGLKLWSKNINYSEEAKNLLDEGVCGYIELYIVPHSFKDTIKLWKKIKRPYIIHSPNPPDGINLSDASALKKNVAYIDECNKFAYELNSDDIIIHPGYNGKIEDTIDQINKLNNKRLAIENNPYLAIDGESICNGNTPEEIKTIIDKCGTKFCLDIAHAICASNSHKTDPIKYVDRFLKLSPSMFHLSDGNFKGEMDDHLHFGKGSYPLEQIIKLLPDNSRITIETPKSNHDLSGFIADIQYIKKLFNNNKQTNTSLQKNDFDVFCFRYKNFIRLSNEEKLLIYQWRNNEQIRKQMSNSRPIPINEHLSFIEKLKTVSDKTYWLVFLGNTPIGVVDLYDFHDNRCWWGIYVAPDLIGQSFGFALEFSLLELVFNRLKLDYIECEVLKTNTRALKLYEQFGFIVSNTINNKFIMKMQSNTWKSNRNRLLPKAKKIITDKLERQSKKYEGDYKGV